MTDPLALDGVMAGLASKLDAAVAWLTEIEDERRTAMRQIEDLRAAIRALAHLMPEGEADHHLSTMHQIAPLRPHNNAAIGRTPRSAAVMHVLATHPEEVIRTTDLQRHLNEHALAKDNRAAAWALAQKGQTRHRRKNWTRTAIGSSGITRSWSGCGRGCSLPRPDTLKHIHACIH